MHRLRPAVVVVVALAHRKYVDVNRSEAEGTESSDAVPGQAQLPDTIFRGTRHGRKARALIKHLGPVALPGPHSLTGELAARGCTVAPLMQDTLSAEDYCFLGGHTVASCGSHQPEGIDAIQLEFIRYAGYLPANAHTPGA